jgi:hypothetical protein
VLVPSAQGDIARNGQKQDSLFVEREWKPDFVIEFGHCLPLKIVSTSLSFDFYG